MITSNSPTVFVKTFLPRIYQAVGYLTYYIGRAIGVLFFTLKTNSQVRSFTIAVEAGKVGWESPVYNEIFESAMEYFGQGQVCKIGIDRNKGYTSQVYGQIKSLTFKYYFFDPRTTSTNFTKCSLQIFALTFILGVCNVKPIVMVTDFSVRMWRYGALALTAKHGHVFNFLETSLMGEHHFHSRVLSLQMFPMSKKTFQNLESFDRNKPLSLPISIGFVGAIYSSREFFFKSLREEILNSPVLNKLCQLDLKDKDYKDGPSDYFKKLAYNDAIITTTIPEPCADYIQDRLDIPQMVFRITEALALGKLLICTPVPGMERYIIPDVDYILLEKIIDIKKINKSLEELELIRQSGHAKMKWHIQNQTFWKQLVNPVKNEL